MAVMTPLVEKQLILRANGALLATIIGGGLVACVFGSVVYDVGHWIAAW